MWLNSPTIQCLPAPKVVPARLADSFARAITEQQDNRGNAQGKTRHDQGGIGQVFAVVSQRNGTAKRWPDTGLPDGTENSPANKLAAQAGGQHNRQRRQYARVDQGQQASAVSKNKSYKGCLSCEGSVVT